MTNPAAGVAGLDGVVPVYDPNGLWKTWALPEIYTGAQGADRYVPKVNDYVVDYTLHKWYIVTAIDPTTLLSTLADLPPPVPTSGVTDDDVLLGAGAGTTADTYRAYINKNVMPYTLSVDKRLRIFGVAAETAKLFIVNASAGTKVCISAFYDSSGTLLGQSIPLEIVATPLYNNRAIKAIPTCYTTTDLADGEVIVAEIYSDDGHVVSQCKLLAQNTSFISTADASVKYITGISLESPFLSQSDPRQISFPINVPMSGLSLIGVVNYSDGSVLKMPVDQTKFSMFGFNGFVDTLVGQTFNLVLSYRLSSEEVAYGMTVGVNNTISQSYTATTLASNGIFTPKLYGYPVWIDAINGYRLEWWLYDLDRDLADLATPFVKIASNSPAFDPLGYGRKQTLTVVVNLKDVMPSAMSYNHVQAIDIILRQPGTVTNATLWEVGFNPNQNPPFGDGNVAKTTFINSNLMNVDLTCGETVLENWLTRLYSLTMPLTDPTKEIAPPTPDYFSISTTSWEIDYPINQWNTALVVNNALLNGSTVFVKFFQRTADTDIQLAIAGVPVMQLN